MQVGVIGLGNIGGHDRHQPRHRRPRRRRCSTSTPAACGVDRGRRGGGVGRGRRRRRPRSRCSRCRRPRSSRQVADEWATTAAAGLDPRRPLDEQPRRSVRELGARLTADRPPPRRGAAHRRRASGPRTACSSFMVGGDDEPGRAGAAGARAARPGVRSTSARSGLGNTMKLVNSLIAYTTTWVEPRGAVAARPRPASPVQRGGRGAAHRRRRRTSTSTAWSRRSTSATRPTQFALELAAKDAGLIVDTGARARAYRRPPAPRCCRCSWARSPSGLGDHDWSDLVAAAERQGDVELKWNA